MITIKLPTRLATVLGSIEGLAVAYITQTNLSGEVKAGVVFAAVVLAAIGIHPTDTTQPAGPTTPGQALAETLKGLLPLIRTHSPAPPYPSLPEAYPKTASPPESAGETKGLS